MTGKSDARQQRDSAGMRKNDEFTRREVVGVEKPL